MFSGLTKWLSVSLAVLAVTAVMLAMHFRASAAVSADRQHQAESRAAQLDASLKASEAARDHEHAEASQFQAITQQYEQDKTDAEARATRLAADLRAERVRLRPEWRCEVPGAATSAGKPDAAAELRAEGASHLVGNADAADAEIRRLQEILRAERQ
jgi:hypothetical protein